MEIYVDDIVVFGNTAEECLENMNHVLLQAEQFGLEINWGTCQFLKERLTFLYKLP